MGIKEMHEASIVKLEPTMGLIVLLLNIFAPPLGTAVAGFIAGGESVKNNLIMAIIQWICLFVLVGWCWAIYTGWLIYNKSK